MIADRNKTAIPAVSIPMTRYLACAALLAFSTPALAQDENDYRVRVGLGAMVQPVFIGSEDFQVRPIVDADFAKGTNPFGFGSPDDPIGVKLFSKNGFSVGPAVNLQRKRSVSDLDLPLKKVPTTFEGGGFVQYMAGESFRIRADLRKGFGGHDGLLGSVGADYVSRDGDRYVFAIGPRVLFSDSKFQRAYFGVSPADSVTSGLPQYRPSGGIYALAATSSLSYQLSSRWGIFGYGRYERLVGDAAKSPVIRDLGSRNQLSGGIGLNYTFIIKR